MINKLDGKDIKEGILVCITVQRNSKRLIDYGAELAKEYDGKLHILHIQKGNSIFTNQDTAMLLEHLFSYACEKGGEIYALCDDDIPECIGRFVLKECITKVVLGEPPNKYQKNAKNELFYSIIGLVPEGVESFVVGRPGKKQKMGLKSLSNEALGV